MRRAPIHVKNLASRPAAAARSSFPILLAGRATHAAAASCPSQEVSSVKSCPGTAVQANAMLKFNGWHMVKWWELSR
ncbi:hypothetical protein WJX74_008436 [Apatococcus lobatus]|uniref:Uncharacterized protein n=1 Tax=Apatococcus lobatus TaxID=904363 RepID=A0AAW1QIW0_9CHLO